MKLSRRGFFKLMVGASAGVVLRHLIPSALAIPSDGVMLTSIPHPGVDQEYSFAFGSDAVTARSEVAGIAFNATDACEFFWRGEWVPLQGGESRYFALNEPTSERVANLVPVVRWTGNRDCAYRNFTTAAVYRDENGRDHFVDVKEFNATGDRIEVSDAAKDFWDLTEG